MKIHKETIEALIALYDDGHRILEEEKEMSVDADEALEAAAIDYIMSDEHRQFCNIIDNLEEEACRELIALMLLGRDQGTCSVADFDRLKSGAQTGAEAGDTLFGQKQLPEYWRAALAMLAVR